MNTDLSRFHQVFFEEAAEHLDAMEQLLVGLDPAAPSADGLNAIFRAAHSIKGGSGTFGFGDLTEVTHILETLLDKVRNRDLALHGGMIDAFLEAGDVLRGQLAGHRDGAAVDPRAARGVMERLNRLAADAPNGAAEATAPAAGAAPANRYRVVYSPAADGKDEIAETLLAELSTLGEASLSFPDCAGGPRSYLYLLATGADEAAVRDVFAFAADADEFCVETFGEGAPDASDIARKAVQEEDPGYGFFTEPAPVPPTAAEDPGYGFFAPLPSVPAPAQRGPEPAPESRAGAASERAAGAESSIRVSVEKVDQMINLVGELVITQAMLAQSVAHLDPVQHERIVKGLSQLERNTRDLQESVMSIRMMPMSLVFNRFPRVVRELAAKLGKQVELRTEGEGTELDKGLIEKIVDPLTHLIRNSLDHGIEPPELRQAAGKPRRGTLTLRATHQGGNIVIEVEDDGAGLCRRKLLKKAAERGLPASDELADKDLWQLIFAPGFSTAEAVTDVSGRGVGMDVVKRNVDALGGRVEIHSEEGRGTKVTVRLPLTLAILDGMSVAVGKDVFILPLNAVVESLQAAAQDVRELSGQGRVVHVRGEYLPLVCLYQIFGLVPRHPDPTHGILVIVEAGAVRVALLIDELLGQHQVVIKSLESNYRRVEGIAGATIMGDGRVALIVDVAALGRMTHFS